MSYRKWLGDIGFAVLLALPTGALTRPQITGLTNHTLHTPATQSAFVERSVEHRVSLFG
jgi:hypothetical protein